MKPLRREEGMQGEKPCLVSPLALQPKLTPRETEVLSLIVKGQRDKEIAAQLAISGYTVRNHLSNVMNKTGIHNRTILAIRYAA